MNKGFRRKKQTLLLMLMIPLLVLGFSPGAQERAQQNPEAGAFTGHPFAPERDLRWSETDSASSLAITEEVSGVRTERIAKREEKNQNTRAPEQTLSDAAPLADTKTPLFSGASAGASHAFCAILESNRVIVYIHDQDGQKEI